LGTLQSITVQRDSSGLGSDWFLDTITVQGFAAAPAEAVFQSWIAANQPVTKLLARSIGTATD
jgi:hypothetical protein